MKNLVMGAAKGYGWQELEPFVASCKKFCPDADLILFVDDISEFTRDKMTRAGVTLESFPTELTSGIPNNTRWKIFADYLEAHGGGYAQVFLTDTRDVIFQGDLFAPFKGFTNWLGCATENAKLGAPYSVNRTWLIGAFNKAEADKLADKKIICSGTVIGSIGAMKIFCRKMWELLIKHAAKDIYDQAVMNYLVWNNLLPIENLLEFDVQSGIIFTNGFIENNRTCGDKILRGDGGIPAVVHQYDRHRELAELVDKIYRDKNFSFDPRFSDTRSTVEQVACLLCLDKTVEATQIFLRQFLSPADFNEAPNALINALDVATKKKVARPFAMIESAIQNALLSVEKLSIYQVFAVFKALRRTKNTQHAVDPQLKENIAARLLKFAEDHLDAGDTKFCIDAIELIEDFDVPPNKNFHLLLVKANRLLRRKDDADHPMKNLVMGAATGYGWQDVEPFVTSCKKFCPDAELVLFVDDISDFTRDKLTRAGVTVEKISVTFNDALIIHTRWKMYADYLEARNDFAQVFISDTRDVIFQGDLFAPFKGHKNWLGYATETDKLGVPGSVNYNWFVSAFGKAEADKIADKKVICAGTVIGSSDAMKIFCRIMWNTLKGNRFWGHDQAAMNYFVWNNLLPIEHLLEFDVTGGEIFTAAQFHRRYPVKIRGEKILRSDGGVPAVVHQYDRHEKLLELVDKIYRDKNFSFDARFSDTRSTVEQVACLLYADKTVEAAQIFLRKFMSPADFGKSLNTLINILDIATQKNFSPPVELIELAVQNVLMSAEKFSIAQVFAIHKALIRAIDNQHAVDPQFKENVAAHLLKFAEDYLNAGDTENYNLLLEMAQALDA